MSSPHRREPLHIETMIVVVLALLAAALVVPSLGGDAGPRAPERFVAGGRNGITLVDASSGRVLRQLSDLAVGRGALTITPDRTVYAATRDETPVGCGLRKRVWRIEDDGGARRLAVGEDPIAGGAGRRVAFSAGDCETMSVGVGIVDPSGRREVRELDIDWGRDDFVTPGGWRDPSHVYVSTQPGEDLVDRYLVDVDRQSKAKLPARELGRYDSAGVVGDRGTDGRVPVLAYGPGVSVLLVDAALRDPKMLLTFPRGLSVVGLSIDPSHRHVLYSTFHEDAKAPVTLAVWRWSLGDDRPALLIRETDYSSLAWVPE